MVQSIPTQADQLQSCGWSAAKIGRQWLLRHNSWTLEQMVRRCEAVESIGHLQCELFSDGFSREAETPLEKSMRANWQESTLLYSRILCEALAGEGCTVRSHRSGQEAWITIIYDNGVEIHEFTP